MYLTRSQAARVLSESMTITQFDYICSLFDIESTKAGRSSLFTFEQVLKARICFYLKKLGYDYSIIRSVIGTIGNLKKESYDKYLITIPKDYLNKIYIDPIRFIKTDGENNQYVLIEKKELLEMEKDIMDKCDMITKLSLERVYKKSFEELKLGIQNEKQPILENI